MNQEDPPCAPSVSTARSHQDLLAMVYEELRSLAAARMAAQAPGHTLQPTALVHEAWLRLSKTDDALWNGREHFFRAAAIAMRQILVDHARAKIRRKGRLEDGEVLLSTEDPSEQDAEFDVLIIHQCLEELEKDHPDCARVVQLKFFAGLNNPATAEVLGCSLRSVERLWAFARFKLFEMVSHRRETRM